MGAMANVSAVVVASWIVSPADRSPDVHAAIIRLMIVSNGKNRGQSNATRPCSFVVAASPNLCAGNPLALGYRVEGPAVQRT